MRLLREGYRRKAICPACERRVNTHYEYRTVHLEQTGVDVENVLVGVCDVCDRTVSIPAQSMPKLKEARKRSITVFNARLPQHLDDALYLIADQFDVPFGNFCGAMLRYYFRVLAHEQGFARRVGRLARSELARGRANARISLRIEGDVLDEAWSRARKAGVRSRSAMLRGIILAAQEDVIEGKSAARRQALAGIASAA